MRVRPCGASRESQMRLSLSDQNTERCQTLHAKNTMKHKYQRRLDSPVQDICHGEANAMIMNEKEGRRNGPIGNCTVDYSSSLPQENA